MDEFCGLCCHRFKVGEQKIMHLLKHHPEEVYEIIMKQHFELVKCLWDKYIIEKKVKCEHKLVDDGKVFRCIKCGEKFCAWVPLTDETL